MAAYIADFTKESLIAAALEADSVAVSETTGSTDTIATAKVGHRAALIAFDAVWTGAGTLTAKYGSGPTSITGAIPVADGARFSINPQDANPIIAPENEDLKLTYTSATSIAGHYKVAYLKVR